MLVDDQNKKCLLYGSSLYKSFRENPACRTVVSSPPHLREIYIRQGKQCLAHYGFVA